MSNYNVMELVGATVVSPSHKGWTSINQKQGTVAYVMRSTYLAMVKWEDGTESMMDTDTLTRVTQDAA